MAAPSGVSSGSVPEPRVPPEAAATEPLAPAPADPEPSEPTEPSEPADGEGTAAIADPEPEPLTGERPRQARGVSRLVTVGVVILVLALAAAAGALVVTTHGFRHRTIVTYRPAAVFALRAGDCLNSSSNGLSVTVLSCATPHQAEVFATFSLAGSGWPGSAAVQQQASGGCSDRIAGYMNPQLLNAGLTEQYVFPDQKAWQAGLRTVVCEVSSSTGPLTGSVRSAG
jgi:Septum formation